MVGHTAVADRAMPVWRARIAGEARGSYDAGRMSSQRASRVLDEAWRSTQAGRVQQDVAALWGAAVTSGASTSTTDPSGNVSSGVSCAASGAGADAGPLGGEAGPLRTALDGLEAAVDTLAAVALDDEGAGEVAAAAVRLQRLGERVAHAGVMALGEVDRREVFAADGAATVAAWVRTRANLNPGRASQLASAARRLRRLPALDVAFAGGQVSLAHVTAITDAAVPQRMDAIVQAEEVLVDVASCQPPRVVARVVSRIRDLTDSDGTDAEPLEERGPDVRRELRLSPGIDGLWHLRGTLDPLTGEALATALDAMEQPDPSDTPVQRLRSPAQRRHDALDALVRTALDSGSVPTAGGVRPHIHAVVDLATLIGADGLAVRTPRLTRTGPVAPAVIRRLAWQASITCVLTMGPWRVANVGRTHRSLPSWLRAILTAIHHHCRGPDCDRPASWSTTDAHHVTAWAEGGDTDLNQMLPLCGTHHDMVTVGDWTVSYDAATGTATWTGPDGTERTTSAPDPADPFT